MSSFYCQALGRASVPIRRSTTGFENGSSVHIVLSVLAALLFPTVLIGPRWISSMQSNRIIVHFGTRSYAVSLIHRLAKGVDRSLCPGLPGLSLFLTFRAYRPADDPPRVPAVRETALPSE